ncbi:aspartyl/asparaginyl beta-hydroxylase domain-containing protein [Pseudomonas shirazensis]
MPEVPLPLCSRLPLAVDLAALLQALAQVDSDLWRGHFNTAYHQGDWSGIDLIAAADAHLPLAPGAGAPVQQQTWQHEPAWHSLRESLGSDLRAARLLRLGPGARIHEHRDPDLGRPDGCLRLHVPLLSPAGVEFLLDDQQVPMQPGECWFLDLSRPHRVDNSSEAERINLVLDCEPTPALLSLIEQGLEQTPQLQASRAGQAFAQFRLLLTARPELAASLQALTEPQAFIEHTRQMGAAAGLYFAEADVRSAMRQGKQAWNDQWRV